MDRIRVGHIGTHHDHSTGKMDCVRKFPDVFEVVGIVEEDLDWKYRIQDLPSYRDIPFMTEEELFNRGVDCVLVEGFEYDLPRVAKRCVENGAAVHIDKPAGRDLRAFEDTLRIAKKKNLPVQMAYMYRYNPAVRDCLKRVRNGELGDILNVTAIMNTGHSSAKRQWLAQFDQGGIMFFLGCHMVDLVHQVQGVPDSITPFLRSSGLDGTTAVDQATAIFSYPAGTSIVQANACEINGYGRRQLVVCGSRGTYEIRPLESPIRVMYTDRSFANCFEDRHTVPEIPTVPKDARYDEMMMDFAAMIRGEKENPFSYEYELINQRMILAACGEKVDLHAPVEL